MEYKELSKEVKDVILGIAKSYAYDKHSNYDEIDYKFYEDVGTEEIVLDLACKIAELERQIKWLKDESIAQSKRSCPF